MKSKNKAWNVVTTLFICLLFCGMVTIAALWFITPIFSVAGYEWAAKIMEIFYGFGLYR